MRCWPRSMPKRLRKIGPNSWRTCATRVILAPMLATRCTAVSAPGLPGIAPSRPKPASRAFRPGPHRRLSRWRSQTIDAPGENPLRYQMPRRVPHLPQNICSRPLTGSANQGHTVNSRRAQVRRELQRARHIARRNGVSSDIATLEVARINFHRLKPNTGSWIKGGTSRADGNYLYGAIVDELGIPLLVARGFGDAAEFFDDIRDRTYGGNPDEGIGGDSPEAKRQINAGATCPG